MKQLLLLLIILSAIMPLAGYAQNPFSPAQGFNVFLSGNASLSSNESEGPIAIGGNLTVNGNYNVNIHGNGTFQINNTLIGLLVGGTINYSSGTLQLEGNSYLKIGNCSGSTVWYKDNNGASSNIEITPSGASYGSNPNILIDNNALYFGSNISNTNPICDNNLSNDLNFSSAFIALSNSSSCLNGLSGNAVLSNPNGNVTGSTIASVLTNGQLKITLSQGVNVLNCSGNDLNSVTNGITFNNSPDANHILVINVNASGSFTWNVWNQAGVSGSQGAAYIIYNFPNTTSLNISGNSTIEGSILAPNASITKSANQSNIEGQVVAASFTQTSGEVHYYPFAGSINCGISAPVAPTVTLTQPTCSIATGTITITAPIGSGITYSIDGKNYQASGTFNSVAAGTYSVYAKNAGGVSAATSVTINAQPATPSVPTVNLVQPTCNVATGTITVTAPTGLSYSIDGSNYTNTTGIFSTVATGTYTVYAKNGSGCISTTTATINAQPATPAVPTVTLVQPTCNIATGTITVTAPTGLNYSIDGSNYTNTSGIFNSVATGTYTVYAKNSSGCISTTTATINAQPATPAAPTVSLVQPICGITTGTITVSTPIGSG